MDQNPLSKYYNYSVPVGNASEFTAKATLAANLGSGTSVGTDELAINQGGVRTVNNSTASTNALAKLVPNWR
jgi:hypothetical protein